MWDWLTNNVSSWLPSLITAGGYGLSNYGNYRQQDSNNQWQAGQNDLQRQWSMEIAKLNNANQMAMAQMSAEVAMKQLEQQKIRDAISAVLGGGGLKQTALGQFTNAVQRPWLR